MNIEKRIAVAKENALKSLPPEQRRQLAELYRHLESLGPSEEERAKRKAEADAFEEEMRAEHEARLAAVKLISRGEYNRRRINLAERIKTAGIIWFEIIGWDCRHVDTSLTGGAILPPPTREEILALEGMENAVEATEEFDRRYPPEQMAKDIEASVKRTKAYGKMIDFLLSKGAIDKKTWDILHNAYVPDVDLRLLFQIYQLTLVANRMITDGLPRRCDVQKEKMVEELLARLRAKSK